MVENKPTYLIFYKDKDWMIDYIGKSLGIYSEDLITHTSTNDIHFNYEFKYFDVLFVFTDCIDDLNVIRYRNKKFFSILIENGIKVSDECINKNLMPMLGNPFIGSIHTLK